MLNENQQKVVEYKGDKPLLVEAGPGSGKTRVIIERVKFLINELKINPSSVLVITFTRKAANELKERLSGDIPKDIINQMQISTIHSFCLDFLKNNGIVTNLFVSSKGLPLFDVVVSTSRTTGFLFKEFKVLPIHNLLFNTKLLCCHF